jgi:hypothetical protein
MYGESLMMRRGQGAGRQCIPYFTLLFHRDDEGKRQERNDSSDHCEPLYRART